MLAHCTTSAPNMVLFSIFVLAPSLSFLSHPLQWPTKSSRHTISILHTNQNLNFAKMTLANLLGPLRKVGVFFFGEQLLDVPRRFDELLERIMEEHEERARRDGGEIENKDLMDIVLEAHHDKDAEVKISRTQMKSFFLDLFFGGTSTTAHSMQWLMAEMINHPQVFKKLREEIDSLVGRNRLVEDSDIPSLHYLQAVVKETLRLHPPVKRLPLLWQMSHPPLCLVEFLVVAPFMPQLVAYFKACLSHQS